MKWEPVCWSVCANQTAGQLTRANKEGARLASFIVATNLICKLQIANDRHERVSAISKDNAQAGESAIDSFLLFAAPFHLPMRPPPPSVESSDKLSLFLWKLARELTKVETTKQADKQTDRQSLA